MAICLSMIAHWTEELRASRRMLRSQATSRENMLRICTGCMYMHLGGTDFVDLLILCPDLRRLRIVISPRKISISSVSVEMLDQYRSLSLLRELTIQVGGMQRYDLFLLFSLLPRLHTLKLISPRLYYGAPVIPYHEPPESCPAPACSLVRLSIIGNMRGGFVHLPLLLRNSHSTLRELCLEHVGDKEAHPAAELVGQSIGAALAHCSNLRDLALCCHDLALVPLLSVAASACHRLRHLTLPRWPDDDEVAAIPRGVRKLGIYIYDMSALPPDDLSLPEASQPWYDLRSVAHLPLSELQVVCTSPTLDVASWMSLKADCARRRVKFTWTAPPEVPPGLSWMPWLL